MITDTPPYNFSPFPEISTPRLLLSQLSAADAPAILILRSDPVVMRYLDRPSAKSLEDAMAFIHRVEEDLGKGKAIT